MRVHAAVVRWVAAPLLGLALLSVSQSAVIINEIMQNPSAVADSAGEWFELFNSGTTAVDINGWTIEDNDIDSHTINNGGPLVIPGGGYLVLGPNGDSLVNGGVAIDYAYGSGFFLANGDDELVLRDGTLSEIDRVEWDGGPSFPDPNGRSMALKDPGADNNSGANWATSTAAFGAGDLGTPGECNYDVGGACVTSFDIVINEIMQNPSAVFDSAGEWFELFNPGTTAIDINGWTIEDNDSDSHTIDNGSPLLIAGGGFLVLGRNGDISTNGGVVVDYAYGTSFALANGDDELVLLDDKLLEVDRVEWDGGPSFPDPNGASMALKDPGADNNVGANWATSVAGFGAGDLGTPSQCNRDVGEVCASSVPEPATTALLAVGGFGAFAAACVRNRRRGGRPANPRPGVSSSDSGRAA